MSLRTLLTLAFCILPLLGSAAGRFAYRLGSATGRSELPFDPDYNILVSVDLNRLIRYEGMEEGRKIATETRQEINRTWHNLNQHLRHAEAEGRTLCLVGQEVSFPREIWESLLERAPDRENPGRVDLDSPVFWSLYRSKYRELLSRLPERVGAVMITSGEPFEGERFRGQTVLDRTYDDRYFRVMSRLISETRSLVVDEGKRTLVWRLWDRGNEGLHANPAVYDRLFAGVTNRTGLVLSLKYTRSDFWIYNEPNPSIARRGIPQIIEFQPILKYGGRGAFPNYPGVEYATAIRRALAQGIQGIYCHGITPGGPAVKSGIWRDLNLYALIELARNPRWTPENIALAWAIRFFGKEASSGLLPILMKSRECVKRIFYVEAYARRHPGWMVNQGLFCGDLIRGDGGQGRNGPIGRLYEGARSDLMGALQEKRDAVALAYQLREDFERLREPIVKAKGVRRYEEALTGFIYLQQLANVACHYVRGIFLFYRWQEDPGGVACAQAAYHELKAWEAAWKAYRNEIPLLPGAPSLFRSDGKGGMEETCIRALDQVKEAFPDLSKR